MTRSLLLLLCASIMLVGCGASQPAETLIPITTVIDFSGWEGEFTGQYRQPTPMCLLEPSEQADNLLTAMVNPTVRNQIQQSQQPQTVMIACFLGLRQAGGASLSIQSITIKDAMLQIYVAVSLPQPNEFAESGTHSPVSVVRIDQSTIPRNIPLTLRLINTATKQELAKNSVIYP
ncbi:protease complex subunit PrcB family protein [Herpetosiphon sp. NSE202]|uniref:protease complex subunit PrcB family protein n=1 Tax=Herpetosiphon sp. NSE202 TaxID=3351349 RepID=UPI003635F12B